MSARTVYLDYNASAPVRPGAKAAVIAALDIGANASSVHAAGRAARALIETAREAVADLVGGKSSAVTFVSGGAEANALAIESAIAAGCTRIVLGATEHDTVRQSALESGLPIVEWPVDDRGVADLDWLAARLAEPGRALVCLMAANNETGVIQPVVEASSLVGAAGGWLHVDAVQAAGKSLLDISALGRASLSLSAHKLGGPQGAGAVVVGEDATLTRRLHGGGQERGLRAGTENVPGIAGFGVAAREAGGELAAPPSKAGWRDALARQVAEAGAVILGEAARRLDQTLCCAMPGHPAEMQVIALDLAGVRVSAGAACSSGKVRASHVVAAMGRSDLAPFAIRVSGGWASTQDDWLRCGEAWSHINARRAQRRAEFA
ncbi:MAG TPA: cysteine desulfurase family protein [Caulobacteraceae bacterium]|nr:cysteine desulfurase family protein [Caulobacteraceae bacterium]